MTMKLYGQAADDVPVTVPAGWPAINVSGFQLYRSLENKVDPTLIENLLTLAAEEVTENFDMELLTLPLEGTEEINFEYAVYEAAYAKLLPLLPVHNQLDSDKADPGAIMKQVRQTESSSLDFQRKIPGFSPKLKSRIGSYTV